MKTKSCLALGLALLPLVIAGCSTMPAPEEATEYREPTEYLAGLGLKETKSKRESPVEAGYWDGDWVRGRPEIVIDLSEQMAYFYKSDVLVGVTPIASGDAEHETPIGDFRVTEKDIDHRSSRYGDYVDDEGNVVVKDVDNQKDKRPAGTKYLGADMAYFLRFNRGIGMHRGYLPGYPASHGCVRQPEHMAKKFFEHARLGTPVKVVP